MNRKADYITNKLQINYFILQKNQDDSIIYNKQNAVTLRVYNRNLEKKIKQELAKNLVI